MDVIQFSQFLRAKTLREAVGTAIEVQIQCPHQRIELNLIPESEEGNAFKPDLTIYYEYIEDDVEEKIVGIGRLAEGFATSPIGLDSQHDFRYFKCILKSMLPTH